MNANTVTASNGPTMKSHCRVASAEKKKQQQIQKKKNNKNKANKTKRHSVATGQVNMKDRSKTGSFSFEVQMLSETVKKQQLP